MKQKTVFSVFSRVPKFTVITVLCAVIVAVLDVAVKQFLGSVIDAVRDGTLGNMAWGILGIVLVIYLAIKFLQPYSGTLLLEHLRISFFSSFGRCAAHGSQKELDQIDPGQASTGFTSDIAGVCACIDRVVRRGIPDVFLFTFTLTTLFYTNVWLGITAIVASVGPVTAMFFVSKILVSENGKLQQALQKHNKNLAGELGSLEYIKANGLEEFIFKKCRLDLRDLIKAKRRLSLFEAIVGLPMLLCPFITVFAVAAVGGYLVVNNEMKIGELFVAVTLVDNIVSPVMRFDNTIRRIRRGNVCLARLEKLLKITDEADAPMLKTSSISKPLTLTAQDLSFAYTADHAVLDHQSFSFVSGGINALIGENGAGKSTFLKLLSGVLTPDGGEIRLEGDMLSNFEKLMDLRSAIVVDTQQPVFFADTLRNLFTNGAQISDEAIWEICRLLGLAEDFAALPDKLDTVLTADGGFLSGGQKRRVSFAAAMLRQGRVYVFDEPTTGVDDENVDKMIALLEQKSREQLVIVISHDPRVITKATNIVSLEVRK